MIKNGDFSSDVINLNKNLIKQKIQNFTDEKLMYAFFLKEAQICSDYSGADIKIEGSNNPDLYKEIKKYLADYFTDDKLKQDLSEQEMSDINDLCNNKFSTESKRQLDKIIGSTLSELNNQLDNVCLTKTQTIDEIKKIRAGLDQDEAVGYIFTNNRNKTTGHFESIIITKDAIYKPIEWNGVLPDNRLLPTDFEDINFYFANFNHFWQSRTSYMPEQQADTVHCGVLGISAVKRLLQNDAMELTKGSLAVDFYSDEKGSKQQIFIPSPIILQYSQSGKYIDFLSALIGDFSEESDEDSNLLDSTTDDSSDESLDEYEEDYESDEDFEDDELYIRTLEAVLHQSIEYAEQIGDKQMIEKNRETLSRLPKFRDEWQKGCSRAREKRDELVDEYSVFNLFLNFAAKRMQTIITTRTLQPTNQVAFFAESKLSYPPLLLQYDLKKGELESKKLLDAISRINEDLGNNVALEVVDELVKWVEQSKKRIDIEAINEFKNKLQKDGHGISN